MGYGSHAEQYPSQNRMLQAQLTRNQNALSICTDTDGASAKGKCGMLGISSNKSSEQLGVSIIIPVASANNEQRTIFSFLIHIKPSINLLHQNQ